MIYKGKSRKSRKSHKSHKSHPTNPWDGICGDGRDLPNSEWEACGKKKKKGAKKAAVTNNLIKSTFIT